MVGQMSLFDWMPQVLPDPQPGEYVNRHGMVICHIMRPSYIGKTVVYDCSTQSHTWYRAGRLEAYIQNGRVMRSIIYVGTKQRILLDHYPGREIYETANAPSMEERVRMDRDRKASNR